MRRFEVYRRTVPTTHIDYGLAVSRDEVQVEGVEFSNGVVVVQWRTTDGALPAIWKSIAAFKAIHVDPHPEYGTEIRWLDVLTSA